MDWERKLESICLRLYEIGALKFGDFVMKSGANSPVYFDLRVMISHPQLMDELASIVQETVESSQLTPDVICGVPYTALPVATLVSVKMGVPMLLRRKEPKKYGTMKLIEGKFDRNNECLIIEDVVTSGSSILETAQDLRKDGLVVKDVIIMMDREQGGQVNLTNENIRIHSILTLSEVLKILLENRKINEETVDSVKKYIAGNQIFPNGVPMESVNNKARIRVKVNLKERRDLTNNPIAKRLLKIMESKQTNLCLACDVGQSSDLLRIATDLGDFICILKTHYDIVSDWNEGVAKQLREIAREKNFLILEDRKLSDIGQIVRKQCERVFRWADMVTLHSTAGPSAIDGAQQAASTVSPDDPRGVFLVAQLSSTGCLTDERYCQATVDMSLNRSQFLVGLVAQRSSVVSDPRLIQLTPGVALSSGSDSSGQNYVSPETAVIENGGDVIVMGRAILNSPEPQATAKELSSRLWTALSKRIDDC